MLNVQVVMNEYQNIHIYNLRIALLWLQWLSFEYSPPSRLQIVTQTITGHRCKNTVYRLPNIGYLI